MADEEGAIEGKEIRAVGPDALIRHGGTLGVFTPLAAEGGRDVRTTANLGKVVEVLRQEVARLQAENLQLRQLLEQAAAKPRSPDDFSTALAQSIDLLQTRLGETSNPTTGFAVRELHLDAAIHVDVNDLGNLELRFVGPGDVVPAERISRLSLSVVPVPKDEEQATAGLPLSHFTPDAGLDEVHGIGEAHRRKLNASNLFTVRDLLTTGTRARVALELESLLGVERQTLVTWLAEAELVLVRGIDGRTAHLLVLGGVDSLAKLAAQTPAEVVATIKTQAAGQKRLGKVVLPDEATAAVWIEAAQRFPRSG